jgi:hypothetical protein
MVTGMFLAFLLVAIVVLDLVALFGAPDSRDNMESDEWELRRLWRTMR